MGHGARQSTQFLAGLYNESPSRDEVEGQLGWRKTEDGSAIRPPALSLDEIPSRFAHMFKITGVEY